MRFQVIWLAAALIGLLLWMPRPVLAQNSDGSCVSQACISTGPRFTTIDSTQSNLLDALLSNLLGTDLNLTLADSQAFASGEIGLTDYLETLQATLTLASPEQVLATNITLPQAIDAAIEVAQANGDAASVTALNGLQAGIGNLTGQIQLGDLLALESTPDAMTNAKLNLLDLITGEIQLFNQQNLVATPTPVTLSGSDLGLGTIINQVTIQTQVVEAPIYRCGPAGTMFQSAAMRLKLSLDLIDQNQDLSVLETLLETALPLSTVELTATIGQLDVYADIGRGAGVIDLVNFITQAVTVKATPGVVDLYVGELADAVFFDRTRTLSPTTDLGFGTIGSFSILVTNGQGTVVDTDVAIEAKSYAQGARPTANILTFTGPYPQTQSATTDANFSATLVNALVANLDVQLSGSLGEALDPLVSTTILPTLKTVVAGALSPILSAVATDLLDPLLGAGGIGLGEMDVTVTGVQLACGVDPDQDGVPTVDEDINRDGDPTNDDTDGNGTPNYLDNDDDGDGVLTRNEDVNGGGPTNDDTDGNDIPNYLDADDDGDGIPSRDEGNDPNGNLDDEDALDSDGDQVPDYLDPTHGNPVPVDATGDTDGDGVPDATECPTLPCTDTNGNGTPDYLDPDDDGDGVPTRDENLGSNGDPANNDVDGDGIPDYLDPTDNRNFIIVGTVYLPLIQK